LGEETSKIHQLEASLRQKDEELSLKGGATRIQQLESEIRKKDFRIETLETDLKDSQHNC